MSQQITESDFIMPQQKDNPKLGATHFLVCGLGSLGQYCVAKLKEFGVTVSAIDITPPKIWEIAHVPDLLQELIFGDCRQPEVLTKAGIQQCQAVLLVTSDEQVNINTAFAVRIINPQVRLVVRSAKQNLNELLERRLGNFAAFDVNQLPAPAFAIAALGNEIQGLIHLDEHLLRVVKQSIAANHRWCNCRLVHELNTELTH
ncbi:MAG: NAD-binding protein [Rhizonema sp. PD38]|nr:NAD-binding protein [Rhizonema sp. PD38]